MQHMRGLPSTIGTNKMERLDDYVTHLYYLACSRNFCSWLQESLICNRIVLNWYSQHSDVKTSFTARKTNPLKMHWHVPRKYLPNRSSSWDINVKRKVLRKVVMEKKTKNSLRWPRKKTHIEHVIPNTTSLKNITDCYNCGANHPAHTWDLCPAWGKQCKSCGR